MKRKPQQQQKQLGEPPSLEWDERPDPPLGAQVFVPHTEGVYPWVVTSVVGGGGARVSVRHPREKGMFRVERHPLCASHASVVTHWVLQKVVVAATKAAKAKRKAYPKSDADHRLSRPQARKASRLA